MDKRDAILKAAGRLFAESGFGLVGVDSIAAEAGVTKRTLYKQFGSKAGLFEAWLDQRDVATRAFVFGSIEKRTSDPQAQILALFEMVSLLAVDPSFHGCPFSRIMAERGDGEQPGEALAIRHKAALRFWFAERVKAAELDECDEHVEELMTLYEGVLQRIAATGSPSAAQAAIRLINKSWD